MSGTTFAVLLSSSNSLPLGRDPQKVVRSHSDIRVDVGLSITKLLCPVCNSLSSGTRRRRMREETDWKTTADYDRVSHSLNTDYLCSVTSRCCYLCRASEDVVSLNFNWKRSVDRFIVFYGGHHPREREENGGKSPVLTRLHLYVSFNAELSQKTSLSCHVVEVEHLFMLRVLLTRPCPHFLNVPFTVCLSLMSS